MQAFYTAWRGFWETPRAFSARLGQAAAELRRVRSVAGAGLLCALSVVLNQFTLVVSQLLEIGFSFLATALSGFLYGPWVAALAGVAMDLAGYLLRPNGGFFIGFTLNELLAGMIYGIWLYKRPVSLARTFCACLSVVLLINFFLTPLWLNIMYGNAFVLSALRIVKNVIKLPLDTALLYLLLRITSKQGRGLQR